MDLADAFEMLNGSIAFHKAEDLDIPEAQEMMAFVADLLGLQCPPTLPRICIDDEITDNRLGSFVESISIIALKRWDGSVRDQSILAHELSHFLQQFNGVPFSEEDAERARLAWIEHDRL